MCTASPVWNVSPFTSQVHQPSSGTVHVRRLRATFFVQPAVHTRERCEEAVLDDQSDRHDLYLTIPNSAAVWYWRLRIKRALPVYRVDRDPAPLEVCT